jgi:ribosomal protein S18 acetylase RimI-like enzyme
MFAPTSLARQIERAEANLTTGFAEALRRRTPGADVVIRPLDSGVAVYAGPHSPFTKVIGVGFDGDPPPEELEAIERAFHARGATVQAEVATLARWSAHAAFTARGFGLQGFENVLGRALTDADAGGADVDGIEIAPADARTDRAWLDTVITGFEHADVEGAGGGVEAPSRAALAEVFGYLGDVPGFRRRVARIDGQVVGGASVRLEDGVAQLCGAATLPAFRRRGVQSALLRARLREARLAGCDLAVVTTQPGSKSQQNVQRQGFALLYTRAVLTKAPCVAHD